MKKTLTFADQINRRRWWHSPPSDKKAYKKRGMFLASSFKECEFYGRPLDEPIRVNVSNPLVDTEQNIIKSLFGYSSSQMMAYTALIKNAEKDPLRVRFKLDADLFKTAKSKNYDAIAVVTEKGFEKTKNHKLPRSVELNLIDIKNGICVS